MNAETIKNVLIGQSDKMRLVSDNGKEIIHQVDYKGYFGTMNAVSSFILMKGGKFHSSYNDLESALKAWDTI